MVLPFLVSLALPFQGSGSTVAAISPRGQARVTVRLSDSTFARGQRARVYVELQDTAYLLVLHVNGDGRIRILFPLRPVEDALVPGGQWYEIPGPDAREAIAVDEGEGNGTVLAARSGVPFRFVFLASGDDWDYAGALLFQPTGGDPLAAALDILERLADGGRAEVDVTTYAIKTPEGATSHVAAAGATTEPGAIWPSVRSSPYPGGGDQTTDAPATVIINAVCANSYVAEGAVCGSVLINSTIVQSSTQTSEIADFSPHPWAFLHGPRLFRRRMRIEQPSAAPRPRSAQTLPLPPRPSRVRVKRPPALQQYPPLPPPRPPMPDATMGPRIRVAAGGEASRIAPARPPALSAPRAMPEAWRRPARHVPQRPAATDQDLVVSTNSVGLLGAPTTGASGAAAPAATGGATRIVTYLPIGVPPNARPLAARPAAASSGTKRPTARAFPHPLRIVPPRQP